jgi:predicted RNA polymerase sigma factor
MEDGESNVNEPSPTELDRRSRGRRAYERAIALTPNAVERAELDRRLGARR